MLGVMLTRIPALLTLLMIVNVAQSADEHIITRVQTTEKVVALTYDDGPEPYTLQLMEMIEKAGGRATFYVVGKTLEKEPEIVRKASDAGHDIANHTYSHPHLPELSAGEIEQEILRTQDLIEKHTGKRPTSFRAPYLEYNDEVHAVLKRAGLPAINASKSVRDWHPDTTVELIIERSTKDVQPGDIILMHSWSEKTLTAMPEVIRILKEQGYRFVTITELLDL